MVLYYKLYSLLLTILVKLTMAEIPDLCIDCLAKVELGSSGECLMDVGSLSCGVYQIKKLYWIDCHKPTPGGHTFAGGSDEEEDEAYKQCTFDDPCARRCIRSYMSRYGFLCQEDLGGKTELSCEDYGRMHNGGGPSGCSQPRTLQYYVNVLMKHRCIDELSILNGGSQQETTTEYRSVTSGSLEDNSMVTAGVSEVSEGDVSEGDVTESAVTVGAVTVGAVTEGAVTVGAVTVGAVTEGAVTVGDVTEGDMSEGNEYIPVTNNPRSYSMQVMARLRKKLKQHENNNTGA